MKIKKRMSAVIVSACLFCTCYTAAVGAGATVTTLPSENPTGSHAFSADDGHDRVSIDATAKTEHFDNITTMNYSSPGESKSEFWYAKSNIPANVTHYAIRNNTTAVDYSAYVDTASLEFYMAWFDDVQLAAGAKVYAGIAARTSSQYQVLAVDITNQWGTMNWDSGPTYRKISIPLSTLRDSGTLTLATPYDGWEGAYYGTINSSLTGTFAFSGITGVAVGIVNGSAETPAKFITSGIKLTHTMQSPVITYSEIKNGAATVKWNAVNGAEKYYVYNVTSGICYETTDTSYSESVSADSVTYRVYAGGGTLVSAYTETVSGKSTEPESNNKKVTATLSPDDGHDRVSLDATATTEHFDNISTMDAKYSSPDGDKSEFWYAKTNIPANTTHYVIRNKTTSVDYSAYVDTMSLEFYMSWFDDVQLASGAKVYAGIAAKTGSRYQVLAVDITSQWGTMNWDSGPTYRKISIPLATLRDSGTLTQATAVDGWQGQYLGTIDPSLTGTFSFSNITGFAVGIVSASTETAAKFVTAGIKYVRSISAPQVTAKIKAGKAVLTWQAVAGAAKYHVYDVLNGEDNTVTTTAYTASNGATHFKVFADSGDGLVSEGTEVTAVVEPTKAGEMNTAEKKNISTRYTDNNGDVADAFFYDAATDETTAFSSMQWAVTATESGSVVTKYDSVRSITQAAGGGIVRYGFAVGGAPEGCSASVKFN